MRTEDCLPRHGVSQSLNELLVPVGLTVDATARLFVTTGMCPSPLPCPPNPPYSDLGAPRCYALPLAWGKRQDFSSNATSCLSHPRALGHTRHVPVPGPAGMKELTALAPGARKFLILAPGRR